MKTIDKKIDGSGNDLDEVKRIDELSIKTEKLVCPIHDISFENHSDDQLIEDGNLTNLRYQKRHHNLYHTDQIDPEQFKTFKELQEKGISNYDLQAAIASTNKQDHNNLIDLNAHVSGFLMNVLDHIMGKPVKTKLELITLLATSRNQRLAGNSFNLACDGYADSSMVLLRTVMENFMLIDYLNDNQNIVDEFWNGKKIQGDVLVNAIKKKYPEYGPMWGELCDKFVHANIYSIHSITVPSKDPEVTIIHFLPHYDKALTKIALVQVIMFRLSLLKLLCDVFGRKIKDLDKLLVDIATISKVFAEIINDPKLQIEVTKKYGKNL